ncbi:MAG: class I SAM-dependent methyltransferase [Gammaproteobacteria bacterium]
MNRIFVTSFSTTGYAQYGRRFLKDFIKHFPKKEHLIVFYEFDKPNIQDQRITYFDLTTDTDLVAFLERHRDKPSAHGIIAPSTVADYRFQATKFVRKVMAFTSPLVPVSDWTIWIDADVICNGPMPEDFFDRHIVDKHVLAYYIGRPTAWNHSECGFVAYSTCNATTREFLRKFRHMYKSDTVFELPQWHDSYVFDDLRKVHEQSGHKFVNIAAGHDIFHPWPETFLGECLTHLKGPAAKAELLPEPSINITEFLAGCKNRYEQIPKMLSVFQPVEIVEVGTFDGARAVEMCREALKHNPSLRYVGFDLWEQGNDELNALEHNVKGTALKNTANKALSVLSASNPRFTYVLIQGNTRETLPKHVFSDVKRFAFIDGGHSIETIRSDYTSLKPHCTDIILDDFYVSGKDTTKFGCNALLAAEPNIILPQIDNFPGFKIAMALVGKSVENIHGNLKPINLKTRNCAPDADIQANVTYCAQLLESNRAARIEALEIERTWLAASHPVYFVDRVFAPTDDTLYLVSAGDALRYDAHPEYTQTWDALEKLVFSGEKVVCNKTNHDFFIERGIVPYGCVLLDPRDHVASKFTPHSDVIYFTSSMCHKTTWDHLLKARAKIIGYHAAVGAGEDQTVKEAFKKGLMISGGTSSVLRSFWLFYTLGFRNYETYALDSSYWKKPEKTHGRTEKPVIEVDVHGRKFWTDAEMIAQSQDVEALLKTLPDCSFTFHGDGMLQHAAGVARTGIDVRGGKHDIVSLRVATWLHAFKGEDAKTEFIYINNAIRALHDRELELQAQRSEVKPFDAAEFLS